LCLAGINYALSVKPTRHDRESMSGNLGCFVLWTIPSLSRSEVSREELLGSVSRSAATSLSGSERSRSAKDDVLRETHLLRGARGYREVLAGTSLLENIDVVAEVFSLLFVAYQLRQANRVASSTAAIEIHRSTLDFDFNSKDALNNAGRPLWKT